MFWIIVNSTDILWSFCFFSDYVAGGELFTHLYQREHFTEDEVRIYIGEIILALEHLHAVSEIHNNLIFSKLQTIVFGTFFKIDISIAVCLIKAIVSKIFKYIFYNIFKMFLNF